MEIVVCIGSSCHIKGSPRVIDRLQYLITQNKLDDKVRLKGIFCAGKCQLDVCVTIGEEIFSVSPETTDEFFNKNVLARF